MTSSAVRRNLTSEELALTVAAEEALISSLIVLDDWAPIKKCALIVGPADFYGFQPGYPLRNQPVRARFFDALCHCQPNPNGIALATELDRRGSGKGAGQLSPTQGNQVGRRDMPTSRTFVMAEAPFDGQHDLTWYTDKNKGKYVTKDPTVKNVLKDAKDKEVTVQVKDQQTGTGAWSIISVLQVNTPNGSVPPEHQASPPAVAPSAAPAATPKPPTAPANGFDKDRSIALQSDRSAAANIVAAMLQSGLFTSTEIAEQEWIKLCDIGDRWYQLHMG